MRNVCGRFSVRPVVNPEVQGAVHGVDVIPRESDAVAIKTPVVWLYPSRVIEVIEIICPLIVESLSLGVVTPDFNIVVLGNNGKIFPGIETISPGRPGWWPYIHHKPLGLVHQSHSFDWRIKSEHLLTIYKPSDVVWGPFNSVGSPVIEVSAFKIQITLVLKLFLSVSINKIPAEASGSGRGNNFNIDFVPLSLWPVGTVPVQEEWLNSAEGILGFNSGLEPSVEVSLLSLNFTASVSLGWCRGSQKCTDKNCCAQRSHILLYKN